VKRTASCPKCLHRLLRPLPEGKTTCPDSNYLYRRNRVLSSLLHKLDSLIISTVESLDNPDIAVADLSHALDGHEWCTADPGRTGSRFTRSMTRRASIRRRLPSHAEGAGGVGQIHRAGHRPALLARQGLRLLGRREVSGDSLANLPCCFLARSALRRVARPVAVEP